jgi:hypothetical protein
MTAVPQKKGFKPLIGGRRSGKNHQSYSASEYITDYYSKVDGQRMRKILRVELKMRNVGSIVPKSGTCHDSAQYHLNPGRTFPIFMDEE